MAFANCYVRSGDKALARASGVFKVVSLRQSWESVRPACEHGHSQDIDVLLTFDRLQSFLPNLNRGRIMHDAKLAQGIVGCGRDRLFLGFAGRARYVRRLGKSRVNLANRGRRPSDRNHAQARVARRRAPFITKEITPQPGERLPRRWLHAK